MKDIVEKLNKNGYEAYIVGGYVRDYLLGIASNDVDICTNAPIEEIMKIFKGEGKAFKEFYAYHIEKDGYSYDITTFRKELKYKKNKPVQLKIAGSLGEDLLRRDFTINTFAIDNAGRLVDLLGAKKDLNSRIIKTVGNARDRFLEDKTRILRAIRFACVLDFDLDPEIMEFISSNDIHLINEVTKEFIRKELDKIFESGGIEKFFYIANRYKLKKYLNIKYEQVVPTYSKYGVWSQIETDLPFTNKEKNIISSIKELVDNKEITLDDFNKYDKEIIYNASSILKMENKIKFYEEISKLHSIIDIDLDINVFLQYVRPSEAVKTYKLVERSIMEGLLLNKASEIEDFVRKL